MIFNKIKKAISPVVGTSLLLIVAVVAVVSFQSWFGTYSSSMFIKVETDSKETSQTQIETLIGNQLYFKNTLNENITITQIKISNRECNISKNLTTGIHNISLANCMNNLTLDSSIGDIVVITDKQIYTKKYLFKNANIISSSLKNYNYSWINSSWSDCNVTCGSGFQNRIVQCQRNDSFIVSDSFCSEVKPEESKSCFVNTNIILGNISDVIGTVGSFEDCRDNEIYNWRKMEDGKIWMAEGLAYNYGTDGVDSVSSNWNNERYYYESSVIAGLCPQGWHITTKSEWINFVNILFSRSISVFYGDDLWTTSNTGACSTWNSFDEKVNGYYNNGWYYPSTSFCYHNVANNYIVNDLNVFKGSLMWTSGTDPNLAYISSTVSGNAYDWGEIRCIKDY